MQLFFQALLLGFFVAAFANSNQMTKPTKTDDSTTKGSHYNVNNNYNTFQAGANCKKIESMFSDVKQQLAELKEEIKEIKGNQTGDPAEKGLKQKFFRVKQKITLSIWYIGVVVHMLNRLETRNKTNCSLNIF